MVWEWKVAKLSQVFLKVNMSFSGILILKNGQDMTKWGHTMMPWMWSFSDSFSGWFLSDQPFILQVFFEHLYTTGSCCLKIVRLPNSPSATPFLRIIPIALSNMTALLWFYFPCNTICSCEGSQRLPVVGGSLQPNLGWKGDHFISFWHPALFFWGSHGFPSYYQV